MTIKLYHWGRYQPKYKDYNVFNALPDSIHSILYLSGYNYFNFQSNVTVVPGYFSDEAIMDNAGSICLLPYKSVTQSAVLLEAISYGYVPIMTNHSEFHEFVPPNYFPNLYYDNNDPKSYLIDNIYFVQENLDQFRLQLKILQGK